ncbi:hypothetical protein AB0C13_23445 [Streptomyces sp. NPDC049099]|uniref:hypothetical protein n=1 Tax=Streptomyces sp. NPDC049099 TaxID=3155768 RepID=UPI0034219E8D
MLTVSRTASGVRLTVARETTDALLLTALQHGWSVERVEGTAVDLLARDAAANGGVQ